MEGLPKFNPRPATDLNQTTKPTGAGRLERMLGKTMAANKKRHDLKGCTVKTQNGPYEYPVLVLDGDKVIMQVSIPKNSHTSANFKKAVAEALKHAATA